MAKILCATRGGEASCRTQDAAIALALEREDDLVFLYVVDIGFLDSTARAVRPDVVDVEMARLGEFLLAMARERAKSQGLASEAMVRHGILRTELRQAVRELEAATVVLGRPVDGGVYSLADLHVFAASIELETDAEVVILPEELPEPGGH